jgi:uncharacterized protein
MAYLGIALMALSLFLIPLGLPGAWIMVAIVAAGAIYKMVGVLTVLLVIAIAAVAEILEFVFVKRLNTEYGGSKKAFWGAIIGGVLGVIIGLPVPVVGSIVAGFVGSFIGSAAVTLAETRNMQSARRVGWGVVLGRALAAVVKTFAGVLILVIGGVALLG